MLRVLKIFLFILFLVSCSTNQVDFSGSYIVPRSEKISKFNKEKSQIIAKCSIFGGLIGGVSTEYNELLPYKISISKNDDGAYIGEIKFYTIYPKTEFGIETTTIKNEFKLSDFKTSGDTLYFEVKGSNLIISNIIYKCCLIRKSNNILVGLDNDFAAITDSTFLHNRFDDYIIFRSINESSFDSLRVLCLDNQIKQLMSQIAISVNKTDKEILKEDLKYIQSIKEKKL